MSGNHDATKVQKSKSSSSKPRPSKPRPSKPRKMSAPTTNKDLEIIYRKYNKLNNNINIKKAHELVLDDTASKSRMSLSLKKKSIPNKDQINLDVPRTTCNDEKITAENYEKLKVHIKGLLTISSKNVRYTQGDNFVALALLKIYSVNDAYKIFASKGMKRFRMITVDDKVEFIKKFAPYIGLNYAPPVLATTIVSFSLFFKNTGQQSASSCVPKLLMLLLDHKVNFFRNEHNLVEWYFFILKHMIISALDQIKMHGENNINKLITRGDYTDNIEVMTIRSIYTMSINPISIMSNYFDDDNHKYKCHIFAAYAVMLLDKVLSVSSQMKDHPEITKNGNPDKILEEINFAHHLIHNSHIKLPILQGIRPMLPNQIKNIYRTNHGIRQMLPNQIKNIYRTNHIIDSSVIHFARAHTGVLPKLILALYMLKLPITSLSSMMSPLLRMISTRIDKHLKSPVVKTHLKASLEMHLKTIWYFDNIKEKMVTLYDAIKNSTQLNGRPRNDTRKMAPRRA